MSVVDILIIGEWDMLIDREIEKKSTKYGYLVVLY